MNPEEEIKQTYLKACHIAEESQVKNVKKELIKNKLYALLILFLGVLSAAWSEGDCTFLAFAAIISVVLIAARENMIM